MEEKFLLDANTFITPFQNYYPFDLAPGFWTQLEPKLKLDSVYEVMKGEDKLSEWFRAIPDANIIDRRNASIVEKYGEVLRFLEDQ